MRTVTVKMMGGLGNQLFQYAFGRRLASSNDCQLWLDTRWYDRTDERDLLISEYRIRADRVEPFPWDERLGARVVRRFRPLGMRSASPRRVTERSQGYDERLLGLRPSCYVEGYYLSYRYVDEIRESLERELSVDGVDPTPLDDHVAIHIRRGDFVDVARDRLVDLEWYRRAWDVVCDLAGPVTPLVFTDDIDWVAEHLRLPGGRSFEFGSEPGSTPVEDLELMRCCAHQIASRSSFSWWAAWRRLHADGAVVVPSGWAHDGVVLDDDLYPPAWLRLAAA